MDSGINPHRHFVRILVSDALVHLEEVAVALLDNAIAQTLDRVGKIQIDAESSLTHTSTLVTNFLGCAGCNVARREVAEAGILPLEKVVALRIRDLPWIALVPGFPGYPDSPVIPQRFAHQRELRLIFSADRDAGRVDLGKAW